MVTCTPPYALNIGCDPSGAVDNATANHSANCAPPAPPPPPPPAVLPASASAVSFSGQPAVVSRGVDGYGYLGVYNGTTWSGWAYLGGGCASRLTEATLGSTLWVFVKGTDNAVWAQRVANGAVAGWQSLGGATNSDPAVVVDSAGSLWLFARAGDSVELPRRGAVVGSGRGRRRVRQRLGHRARHR